MKHKIRSSFKGNLFALSLTMSLLAVTSPATAQPQTGPPIWLTVADLLGKAMGSMAEGIEKAYCSVITIGDTHEARTERRNLNNLSARLSRVAARGTLVSDELARYIDKPDTTHWQGNVRPELRSLADELHILQNDLLQLESPFVGENPKTYADMMTGVGQRAAAINSLSDLQPPQQPRPAELEQIRILRARLIQAVSRVEAANIELAKYIGARFVQKKGCAS